MSALLERLGIEAPVVQAGMAGGIAGPALAAAVSEAGGLGTLGTSEPDVLAAELEEARRLTGRPVAVNLLLPFTRRAHLPVAARADAIVTFWGRPRRPVPGVWLHQCGSVAEARAAYEAGADGVIAQGVEAGGHVRGTIPALELLERVRAALPAGFTVLVAGGIAERDDVRAALDAGADAVVCGTRFVASEESGARDGYRARLVEARETVLTELFGLGWTAPHRVLWNAAAERWLRRDRRGPAWVRALNRATGPLRRAPEAAQARLVRLQRPNVPLLGPAPPSSRFPETLVDAGALYAGESVARIDAVRPAGDLVRSLTP